MNGSYIYGDFINGKIWALSYDGKNYPTNIYIAKTSLGITSFGVDENNELYICDYGGKIYQLNHSLSSIINILLIYFSMNFSFQQNLQYEYTYLIAGISTAVSSLLVLIAIYRLRQK